MNQTNMLKYHLSIALFSLMSVGVIIGVASVSAAPTAAPPNGNPSFPQGEAGPVGPQGPQGYQGGQGSQGNNGPQGNSGAAGIAWCSYYSGNRYISHGWDGGCAWDVGARFYCNSGRLTHITRTVGGCGRFQGS